MPELQVFDLQDVSMILRMSASKIKNWTIGRPLTIQPSIRTARGKGTRNLYGKHEVYLMGIANHLLRDGFALDAIKKVIDRLEKREDLTSHDARYLLLYWAGGMLRVEVTKEANLLKHMDANPKVVSIYACDLAKFKNDVDEAIAEHEVFTIPSGGVDSVRRINKRNSNSTKGR